MHGWGLVHTDVKHDIILDRPLTQAALASLVAADPECYHLPGESWEELVQAAVSRSLPLPSLAEGTHMYLVAGRKRRTVVSPSLGVADTVSPLHLKRHQQIYRFTMTSAHSPCARQKSFFKDN